MDGWMDGRMDGWADVWMDGWMDGRTLCGDGSLNPPGNPDSDECHS